VILTQTWYLCRPNRAAWLVVIVLAAYALLVAPFVGWYGLIVIVPALVALMVGAGRPRVTLSRGEVVVSNVFRTVRVPVARVASVDTGSGGVRIATHDGAVLTGFALRHSNLLGRHSVHAKWAECANAIRLAAYEASALPDQ
jgi:uncharacterized protein (DUF58 family)